MTGSTHSDFSESWHLFLIERTFLESCAVDPMRGLSSRCTAPQQQLQPFIASSFYIRMVSLLDDGLQQHIDCASVPLPKGYRGHLAEKINLLDTQGVLLNATELHRIRDRRNEVAHEADAKADWEEVACDLGVIHGELEHLGLVGPMPRYELFGGRIPEESDDPDVAFVHRFTCGVKEGDTEVLRLSWSANYHRQSAR